MVVPVVQPSIMAQAELTKWPRACAGRHCTARQTPIATELPARTVAFDARMACCVMDAGRQFCAASLDGPVCGDLMETRTPRCRSWSHRTTARCAEPPQLRRTGHKSRASNEPSEVAKHARVSARAALDTQGAVTYVSVAPLVALFLIFGPVGASFSVVSNRLRLVRPPCVRIQRPQ